MTSQVTKTNIYILKLAGGNYYVGKSDDVQTRFQQHVGGTGSVWTSTHRPIMIEKIIPNADSFDEDKWVKKYMAEKGIDKVRGGSYSSIELSPTHRATLQHEIKGAKDACYSCGNTSHFATNCFSTKSTPTCFSCGKPGHYANECYSAVYNSTKCYRCGRTGHNANECYAKTRVYSSYDSDDSDDYY